MNRNSQHRRPGTQDDLACMFEINTRALRGHVERNFGCYDIEEQRETFFRTTDPATHQLLFDGEEMIGFFYVEERPEEMNLHRISIDPGYQNRGLGTAILRELQALAEGRGVPLRLQVFPGNPALRLYQRLGFAEEGRTETHLQMVWSA